MDWFLYDNGLRHERIKYLPLFHNIWSKYDIDTGISHVSICSNEIRLSLTYLITISLIKDSKNWYSIRLSFLIFTEITKLKTREMFCNHQITKYNTPSKCNCFSNREIKYPQNLIPLSYTKTQIIQERGRQK